MAIAPRIIAISARTRIECRDEHEICRECGAVERPADRDGAVLQRLAQHFERGAVEFWQLVEEQHAVVSIVVLAGPTLHP